MIFKTATISLGVLSVILGVVLTLYVVAVTKVHKEVTIKKSRYVHSTKSAAARGGKKVETHSNTAYGVVPVQREEPEYEVIPLSQSPLPLATD
ncbi:hypothetical protein GBAR_LOCUS9869 [Geodia barretti]|uniref:Uncharacterized protein n=1 Tax=Geodia barretti TaxID=519541 RepID=A0AA35WIV2_GEOBA|nr:hypothetical protein GBAR_LOCUS9869 [Geodia barretti]